MKYSITNNKSRDKDFIVVVRSAGERTVDVCRELIEVDVGSDNVKVIKCIPFEEAIKKSFKIGIESNKKWLVTIDADVLIKKNAIQNLLAIGDTLPSSIFQFEGMLYDGLLLRYRQGGVKCYRTELLSKAIDLVPEPGTQIRPETYTQDAMKFHGYSRLRINEIVGIHDFEQFSKDVFRKCFVHARKHESQTRYLIKKWNQLAKKDPYYHAAIEGAKEGFKFDGLIPIDTRFFDLYYERNNLTFTKYEDNEVIQSKKVEELVSRILELNIYNSNPSLFKKLVGSFQHYGLIGSIKRQLVKILS